jgi:hypothetical protein
MEHKSNKTAIKWVGDGIIGLGVISLLNNRLNNNGDSLNQVTDPNTELIIDDVLNSSKGLLEGKIGFDESEILIKNEDCYEAPYFENLPKNYCSRYAVFGAKELTGVEYERANA